MSPPVSAVELGDFGNQGVVGVWVRQQGANGEEDLPKERGGEPDGIARVRGRD